MNKQINEKIREIEKYLGELESLFPIGFEDHKQDFKIKAICERYFERIIESVVDLSFLIIKDRSLKIPEDDRNAFDVLFSGGIISKELSENLKDAKGMRNIIAHEYGRIDDELVFEPITNELGGDIKELINLIDYSSKKIENEKQLDN